jgi:hypothetical protein
MIGNLQSLADYGQQGRFSQAFIANTERRYKSDYGKDERIRVVYAEGPRRRARSRVLLSSSVGPNER